MFLVNPRLVGCRPATGNGDISMGLKRPHKQRIPDPVGRTNTRGFADPCVDVAFWAPNQGTSPHGGMVHSAVLC